MLLSERGVIQTQGGRFPDKNKGMKGRNTLSSFYPARPFGLFGWSPACWGKDCGGPRMLRRSGLGPELQLQLLALGLAGHERFLK